MSDEKKNVVFNVANVKQLSFSIKEELVTKEGIPILFSTNGKSGYNLEKDILAFVLKAWYHYPEDVGTPLASIEVENTFKIDGISRFIEETEINIPFPVWTNIVAVSISHTRALFKHTLGGTIFQDIIIPLMDAVATAQSFFPKSYQEFVEENKEIHKEVVNSKKASRTKK